jgi:hypothetical protein
MANMASPITALTELSELIYSAAISGPQQGRPIFAGVSVNDPLLNDVQQWLAVESPKCAEFRSVIGVLSEDPELTIFRSADNQPGPMIFHPGGGTRTNFSHIVSSLFIAAAQRIYYMRMEQSRPSFVRAVLENYEELLRAGRGEAVRGYRILGFSGIRLEESVQVHTPWGTLRAAPPNLLVSPGMFAGATAVLTTPRLVSLVISHEAKPQPPSLDQEWLDLVQRAKNFLPLAFALATIDGDRCAPMLVFETLVLPMQGSEWFSLPGMYLRPQPPASPNGSQIRSAEDWCRRLEYEHDDSLQVAERRVVSAIAERFDKADSLIDAIIAWESIVGTRTETVFRVTAALARLLERDASKRQEFRKTLSAVYDTRSRVVHGDVVDQAAIAGAAEEGIVVALNTLKELYSRGADWRVAKSGDRADRIILET